MLNQFNRLLDFVSDYLAQRKGLLPIIGVLLILVNLILQFIPLSGWMTDTNLFLHIGIMTAILGFMLAWAL